MAVLALRFERVLQVAMMTLVAGENAMGTEQREARTRQVVELGLPL
jgi:hypothetical protein